LRKKYNNDMEIYDIKTLITDDNQGGLYDLIAPTFHLIETGVTPFKFNVTQDHEMRMDNICKSLYNNVDYVDMVMDLNDIDNPLNIMSGDVIFYVPPAVYDLYKVDVTVTATNKTLLNQNKSNVKDPNRVSYVENNYQIAPTFLDTPQSPISYSNGKITISPIK